MCLSPDFCGSTLDAESWQDLRRFVEWTWGDLFSRPEKICWEDLRRFEDAQVLLEESRPPAEKKSGVYCCCYCPLSALGAVDNTGWSKETVDCKFLLTDPKFSKSVITRWFLESLYREVLVFCCFKNARCVEFCLSKIFQYKASCTKQGLNTQMLPRSNPNLKQVHKQHTDTLSEAPQTPSSNLQTP